jgi:hypothetical protein
MLFFVCTRCEVSIAAVTQISILRVLTPCSFRRGYRGFRSICFFFCISFFFKTWSDIKFYICWSILSYPLQINEFVTKITKGWSEQKIWRLVRNSSLTLSCGQVRKHSQQRKIAVGGSEAPMEREDLGHVWHLLSPIGKSMRTQYVPNAYCFHLTPSQKSF